MNKNDSEDKTSSYTAEDWERVNAYKDAVMEEFARLKDEVSPDSHEAFAAVRAWQKFLTLNFGDCPDCVLFMLGRAYAAPDEAAKIDEYGKGTAAFMCSAIEALERSLE